MTFFHSITDLIVAFFDLSLINPALFFSSKANYLHNVGAAFTLFVKHLVLINVYECRKELQGNECRIWTRIIVWQEGAYKLDMSDTHPHIHRNLRHQTHTCEFLPRALGFNTYLFCFLSQGFSVVLSVLFLSVITNFLMNYKLIVYSTGVTNRKGERGQK